MQIFRKFYQCAKSYWSANKEMGDSVRIVCAKFKGVLKLIVSGYIIDNGRIIETVYFYYTHLLCFSTSKLQPVNNLGFMWGFPFNIYME